MADSTLPRIFQHDQDDVLVPIKIDFTHARGRVIDSFCWNLYSSLLTPHEFAWKTCTEDNLGSEVIPRFAAQLQEQIDSYLSLIDLLDSRGTALLSTQHLRKIVTNVSVRNNVTEYTDTFQWDAYSSAGYDPETFAKQTCLDLGLPQETAPVIAVRIRETIIRSLLDSLEKTEQIRNPSSIADIVSTITLKLLQPQEVLGQVFKSSAQALPSTRPPEAGYAQALVPPNNRTNAPIWSV